MKSIIKHFDRNAKSYDKERSRGFLGWMIKKEHDATIQILNIKRGERVLDCGCGTGKYGLSIVKLGGDYLGIDVSNKMVEEAKKKGLNARIADMQAFVDSKKFDKILVSGSLEFCKNPEKALVHCTHNLKKNGWLVVIAPSLSLAGIGYFLFHLVHGFMIRLFTIKELKALFQAAGLSEKIIVKPNLLTVIISGTKRNA